jgi:hypothetical protein
MNSGMAKSGDLPDSIDGKKRASSQVVAKRWAFTQREGQGESDDGFGAVERFLRMEVSNTAARQATRFRQGHILGFGSTEDKPVSVRLDLSVLNLVGHDARCRSARRNKATYDCSKCAGSPDEAALPRS